MKIGDQYITPASHARELRKLQKDYKIGKLIGTGSFGLVCTGTVATQGGVKEMAVKMIDVSQADENTRHMFLNKELKALKDFVHPFIVTVLDIALVNTTFYVFMEKAMGGDLFDMLQDRNFEYGMPEPRARSLYRMIADALKFIHDKEAAHRDIKCENILLMDERRTVAKLTDFGFSTSCFIRGSELNPPIKLMRSTFLGTPGYFPPEIEREQPYDAQKADVWSMGVTLYIMVTGEFPFTEEDIYQLADRPRKVKLKFKRGVHNDFKDLITKHFEIDPQKRITMADVLQHQWLREVAQHNQ